MGEAMYKSHEQGNPSSEEPAREAYSTDNRENKSGSGYAEPVDAEYIPADKP